MNYLNNVINFVSWASSPIWQGCSRKASDKTSIAVGPVLAHSGGGASPLTLPLPSGATSAAVAAAQGQPLPSPSLMERMKGFFGYGSSPITTPIVPSQPDTSWVGLADGQTFWQNGVKYRICPTAGDGACAIHAVLGKLGSNGKYEFAQARKTYTDALGKAIIFSTKSDQTFGGFFAVKTLEGFLSDRLGEILSGSFTTENQALRDKIIEVSPKPWFSKPFFDRLKAELTQLQAEVLQGTKHGKDLEALRLKYVQDPIVKEAYLRACSSSQYYFSDQEIEIIAELFNKKVTIFGQTSNVPVTYNSSAKEEVFVHFRGNPVGHYSRLEIVP